MAWSERGRVAQPSDGKPYSGCPIPRGFSRRVGGRLIAQWYELQQTIAPGDQMWVNLNQLIRNRVPDRKGNLLPVDLKSVTYDAPGTITPAI